MDLDKAVKERESVREFSKKKPDWKKMIDAIDSARHTSTAGNNYVSSFIIVSEKEKINKIAEACQQDFISKAHYVVVVCSNPSRLINSYGEKGKIYSRQQAGASIQNFLLKLTEEKLSTCWIGYFVDEQIKKILKIPENVDVEAVFPIGFKTEKATKLFSKQKSKIELERILHFDEYGQKRMK